MPPKFYISAEIQIENIGDELINLVLISSLLKLGDVHVFSGRMPDWYRARIKSRSEGNQSSIELSNNKFSFIADLIFCSLFSRRRSFIVLTPGDRTSRIDQNSRQNTILNLLCQLFGCRVICLGASYQAIPASEVRLLKNWSPSDTQPVVRDQHSVAILTKHDINAQLAPDISVLHNVKIEGNYSRKKIAIVFRDRGETQFQKHIRLIESLKEIVQEKGEYCEIVLFSQVEFDREYSRKLSDATSVRFEEIDLASRARIDTVERFYSQSAFVFSNRLHALLLGGFAGACPLAFVPSDEKKIRGVFDDLNIQNQLLDSDEEDKEQLRQLLSPNEREDMLAGFGCAKIAAARRLEHRLKNLPSSAKVD